MSEGVFTIAAKRPIRAEMTISRNTGLGTSNSATWFSWAQAHPSHRKATIRCPFISEPPAPERFSSVNSRKQWICTRMRYCSYRKNSLRRQNRRGLYLYRNYYKKGEHYERSCKAKEVLNLKELISYEEGSIANVDIITQ